MEKDELMNNWIALRDDNEKFANKVSQLIKENQMLLNRIEKMKNCNNCRHFEGEFCTKELLIDMFSCKKTFDWELMED
jgi:SMC interacting uncharacterized protein involved in chromosome segregation